MKISTAFSDKGDGHWIDLVAFLQLMDLYENGELPMAPPRSSEQTLDMIVNTPR